MSTLKSSKQTTVAPALRALMAGVIDYAGLFPPAKLPLADALKKFDEYQTGEFAWMLGRFVLPEAELANVPAAARRRLSVLVGDKMPDSEVQAVGDAFEANGVIGPNSTGKPVYCQISLGQLDLLDAVQSAGCFAKIRTGGLTAGDFPAADAVAQFFNRCAERKLAFKLTAGLHHPMRGSYKLTYEPNCDSAIMHGFVNVLMAAALAWSGHRAVEPVLLESDPQAFRFDDAARWRDLSLTTEQISDARRHFMHSIGSCSFEEPVADLKSLGWL